MKEEIKGTKKVLLKSLNGYIPLVNAVSSFYEGIKEYREMKFLEKINNFIEGAEFNSLEEISKFFSENFDMGENQQILELVDYIDGLEDERKARYYGYLVKRRVYNKISLVEFHRLRRVIELSFIEDLENLKDRGEEKTKEPYAFYLSSYGIYYLENTWGNLKELERTYTLSELGKNLKSYLNGEEF